MIRRLSSARLTAQRVERLQEIDADPDRPPDDEAGQGRGQPRGAVDKALISDEARGRCAAGGAIEDEPPKASGDYARGVFDRARKSGLILRPPPRQGDEGL